MTTDAVSHNRTLQHGSWEIRWGIYPDEPDPIMISIENPGGPDEWAATTVSLTYERATLLRHALDLALEEYKSAKEALTR